MTAAFICMTVIAVVLVGLCTYLVQEMRFMRLEMNMERQAYVESLAYRAGERLELPTKVKPVLIPSPGGWFAGKTRVTNVR